MSKLFWAFVEVLIASLILFYFEQYWIKGISLAFMLFQITNNIAGVLTNQKMIISNQANILEKLKRLEKSNKL